MFADRRDTCPTARVAQPLRFRQIGFAALQFGGPFRHLGLEFVAGFTKLLLALAYRLLAACRAKCSCGMIRGYREQQLINFRGTRPQNRGAVSRRARNQIERKTIPNYCKPFNEFSP
jgi:hypothetical protein